MDLAKKERGTEIPDDRHTVKQRRHVQVAVVVGTGFDLCGSQYPEGHEPFHL